VTCQQATRPRRTDPVPDSPAPSSCASPASERLARQPVVMPFRGGLGSGGSPAGTMGYPNSPQAMVSNGPSPGTLRRLSPFSCHAAQRAHETVLKKTDAFGD